MHWYPHFRNWILILNCSFELLEVNFIQFQIGSTMNYSYYPLVRTCTSSLLEISRDAKHVGVISRLDGKQLCLQFAGPLVVHDAKRIRKEARQTRADNQCLKEVDDYFSGKILKGKALIFQEMSKRLNQVAFEVCNLWWAWNYALSLVVPLP